MLPLAQVIEPEVLRLSPEVSAVRAIALMHEAATSYALVVEHQQLVGVVTEREVIGAIAVSDLPLEELAIAQVMISEPIALPVTENTDAIAVLALMQRHQLRYLPVVDAARQPIGVVTETSLLRGLDPAGMVAERGAIAAKLQQIEERYTLATASGSAAKFRQLAETINEVFFLYSGDGQQLLYVSPAYETLWGHTCQSLYDRPQSWLDAVHPDDRDRVTAALYRHFETMEFYEEFRIVRPDGSVRWIGDGASIALDADGRPHRIAGTARDITKQKEAEQALHKSEEKYASLVANIPGVIYQYRACFDGDRRIVSEEFIYLSDRCRELFEIEAEAIVQNIETFRSIIHPDDVKIVEESCSTKVLNGTIPDYEAEFRIITPSGQVKWIQAMAQPEFQPDGNIIWDGVLLDISSRKFTEQELEESRRFVQRIAEASPNILYIYDFEKQQNVYINRQVFHILGYTPEWIQSLGSVLASGLIYPEDVPLCFEQLQRLRTNLKDEVFEYEYRMRHADGAWRWLSVRETVFSRDATGLVRQIIGTAEDVTERKLADDRIRTSLEEKEVLLREIHHRVKNNLNIIYSLLNMQLRLAKDDRIRNPIADSQGRIQTMALIHQLLHQSENLSEIDFADYIHRLAGSIYTSFSPNPDKIRLDIRVRPIYISLQTAIPCGLILNELLTNAFKHAFPGDRTGSVAIGFTQTTDGRLALTVRDDGVGMSPDLDLHRVTSLGMRLVQILAQQLRATLEVDRDRGVGFSLTFFADAGS